ncbi:TRAP transporter small permease [Amorphus orientalis]|uniref:TRAP transporter small permease protein n=1 Tax=Amorphus orientalis TaxID=649198 RepID=A0AAE3VKI7_9HYPH|nr:TRAP transporter small permease subunit [Amorphus orientalis]MDQ0313623.1 TRAP-type C4-dicarboxylate transport system permease small subunit [Amorphus orientalis]
MLTRLCNGVVILARGLMWLGFAAMIATVALQVLARNVLGVPMIWTGDVAQLLFTWLIFVGAAVGLRSGVHYVVDLLPDNRPWMKAAADWLSLLAGVAVAYMLLRYGWMLAEVRSTGTVQSLGISRFWMFLPLPASGALMLVFLAEMLQSLVTGRRA